MGALYRNILVAVDGSADADTALDRAIELARDQHARMTIVTVLPPITGVVALAPTSAQQVTLAREGAERILRDATDRVPQDISVTTRLLEGPPARKIVACVKAGGHDLVVMGSHGRGRLGSAILGSVSPQGVPHRPVPVLARH